MAKRMTNKKPSMVSSKVLDAVIHSANKFCRNDGVVKSGCGSWKSAKDYNRKGYDVRKECY